VRFRTDTERRLEMRNVLLVAAAAIFVTATAASAGTVNFYSANGSKVRSATTYGNTTHYYNAGGSRVMSSTRYGNTTNFYNARGSRIGSASR
jgi:hypothetical protein